MDDIYYIIGTAYAGKSTMVKLLAEKYDGIACEENYHDRLVDERLDKDAFPCLCYTRDLQDWREFIRRTPEEYASWIEKNNSFFNFCCKNRILTQRWLISEKC